METENVSATDWRDVFKEYISERYQTIKLASAALGLPETTIGYIIKKRISRISNKTRERIYSSTNLEIFSPESRLAGQKAKKKSGLGTLEIQLKNLETVAQNIRRVLEDSTIPEDQKAELRQSLILSPEKIAERASDLFYAFLDELDYFKRNQSEIPRLKKLIPREDAGYLNSLMNAFYVEGKLNEWMLDASYSPRRK